MNSSEDDRTGLRASTVQRAKAVAGTSQQKWSRVLQQFPRLARTVTIVRATLYVQKEQRVSLAAAGASFWLVLSVVPALGAAVSLFGLVTTPTEGQEMVERLAEMGPGSVGSGIGPLLAGASATSVGALSISFALTLGTAIWTVSSGTYALTRSIQLAYGIPPRNYLLARGWAILGALITLGFIVALAVVVTALGRWNHDMPVWLRLITEILVELPATFLILTLLLMAVYRWSIHGVARGRELIPGAIAAAVGLAGLYMGFTLYLERFNRLPDIYGALSSVIILQLLFYFAVYIVMIGAILNTQQARWNGRGG